MSPGAKTIKAQLGMMDLEYGCFSAMYAIGRMTGALLFVSLVNAVNRKYLMIAACFVKSITVILFKFSNNGYFLLCVRLISGIGHIFPVIYAPIWVNQLNIQKYKYFMSTGISICGPLGRSIGFTIDLLVGPQHWRTGFFINGLLLATGGVILMFYPSIYFSSKLVAVTKGQGDEQLRPSQAEVVSLFNIRESEANERDINVFKKYSIIFTNMVYIFLLLARVVILSLRAIFQFWIPNYVTDVLGFQDKPKKTFYYIQLILLGPFIGSFIGSYFTKRVGGYEKKESVLIILVFNIISVISITPMPFMDKWWAFMLCCTGYQLCGSATLPSLNQIIMTSVPSRLKAKAYAIANVVSTFCGSVPSPVVYGLVNDKMKSVDKKFCMKMFTCYSYVGLLWILLATYFRYQQDKKDSKKEPFQSNEQKQEMKARGDFNADDDLQPQLGVKTPINDDVELGQK